MQGPGQQPPRRRAGDSSGAPGSPDSGLKEWQRNTWYGPAPDSNPTPFEEPEDAPELLKERSSNVSNHTGSFWTDQSQTGYQYPAAEVSKPSPGGKKGKPKKRKGERRVSLRSAAVLAGLLITAVLVLYFGVFRIREIRVIGNNSISSADIIRFSGIRRGDSILRLSEEETERRLYAAAISAVNEEQDPEKKNYNYYRIQFRYLEKEMPGTVTIAVRERETCCFLTWCGIMYATDKSGMVLYETENSSKREMLEEALVEVKGLDIRSGAHLGQTMVLSSAAQSLAFSELFLEMKILGCTSLIREADLINPNSILLTTRDGYTVSLGDSKSIHAKLRSMLLVRQQLTEMGKTGGSINVSNPETPFYSPPSL